MPATATNLCYYINLDTRIIHLVDEFPKPKTIGHTNCGTSFADLIPATDKVLTCDSFRVCLRCASLTGREFDA